MFIYKVKSLTVIRFNYYGKVMIWLLLPWADLCGSNISFLNVIIKNRKVSGETIN